MRNYHFSYLLLFIFVFSCQKPPKPNDEFRTEVINHLKLGKDTLAVYNQFLDHLDSQNKAFGDYFIKTHYEIQDSCDNVLAKKYEPDYFVFNNHSEEDYEFLHDITVKAIDDYEKKLKIDTSKVYIVEWVTNSTPEIKRYLNKKYNSLNLYIPEDEIQETTK